jgi:two-component system, cell cycle sensor histidine kinase and response regulator CckA
VVINRIDWEKIFLSLPEAVAVVDTGYRLVWVNTAMETFIGIPREKIIWETCYSLVHKTEEPIQGCPLQRAMDSRRRESAEIEFPEKNLWFRVTVDPIVDENGHVAGAIRYLSDITSVKEAERIAIRHSRNQEDLAGRLSSLMDNIPGTVYRGLRDWSLTFIGAGVKRITGYAPGEFLSGTVMWRELIHTDDIDLVKQAFRQAVHEKRKILRVEYRTRHKDGSIRWLSDRRRLIYDAEGNFDYVDGLLLDITDRKQSEDALRVTYEKLQTVIEGSPLAILGLDPEGNVTMWNPAAERMTGWSEKEALGRPLPIVPKDKKLEFQALLARARSGEYLSGEEVRRQKKDGSPFDISIWTSPLCDPWGEVVGVMAFLADVTERKQMEETLRNSEEQLRQSQKIEAIGRLAGGIAHDFNNLLTAIRGYSDLLLLRIDSSSPLRRDVEEIQKAGERATSLTRQLLAFSRKQVLQPKVLDLNTVVAGMDGMIRRLIGEDIDLVTVLKPGLWNVQADPGQVEQVIMNLIVNARDAMPKGGKVTIETSNVELDDRYVRQHAVVKPGEYILLSISDTGMGMDEETKIRLFEPFYTTKEKGKGTGLGLSTVYGIVKQSGGYIWVYSEAGKGATFKVYLPRFGGAVETKKEGASGSAPRGRETVLVVEDEEAVRVLVRSILEENAYTVLTASDGVEAQKVGRSHKTPIHLIVTDVVMPKMGGREAAETLAPHLPGVKVLYMSGYTDESIVHHGVLESGIPFLEKPFTPDALLRKVRQTLDA